MNRYRWHRAAWDLYAKRWRAGSLPHALLLAGPAGLAKRALGNELVGSLLCQAQREQAACCGGCPNCRQFRAGTHPDYRHVTLESKRNVIRVEQIRELLVFMTLTSQHRGRKVALVDPADRLHPSAANALLKTLEEPPGDGVFVLVSDMPGRLPATVRSRCVRLDVRPPPMEEVVTWLLDQGFEGDAALAATLSRGRPLHALAWDQGGRLARRLLLFDRLESLMCGRCEVLAAAEDFAAAEARESVDLLTGWAQDLLRLRLAGADAELENSDLRLRLLRLAQSLSPHWLLQRLEEAHRGRQLCDTPVVPQLLVEDLLVGWNGPGVSV